jgi:long-chain acyl-CoA synthetase
VSDWSRGWPTIGQLVLRGMAAYGGREAVVEGQRRLSYAEVCRRALRLGNGLRANGFEAGSRIAYLGDNSIAFLEAYLGLPAAGLVLLPLNTRLATPEIRAVLEDAGARAIIAGPGYEERAAGAAVDSDLALVGVARALAGGAYEDLVSRGSDALRQEGVASDLAYMYYTSGTTGRPKGVMLSHANVLAGALSAMAGCGMSGVHTWLHAGPMFHLADAFALWGTMWLGGRQVCLRFVPEAALEAIEREHVTHLLGVPTMVDLLSEAALRAGTRLDSLVALFYGGAPMPAPVLARARDRLDCALVATYGMTETSGIITCGLPGEEAQADRATGAINIVGREAPLTQLALIGEDGRAVAAGALGEIVVTSSSVMLGYWNRPDETAAVLDGQTLKTGDVGRREANGSIALVDRKKDMIISGGENVYPREVELVLEQHEAVLEAAVVGSPDPHWGETVCAFVRLRPGAQVTLEALRAFARERLAGYKLPRRLSLLEALPRTGSGKIAKAELRRRAAQGAASSRPFFKRRDTP